MLCRRLAAAAMLSGGVMLEFAQRNDGAPKDATKLIRRLSLCAIVFANVDLAKLLVCRILSLRVNSEHLFETMQATPPPIPSALCGAGQRRSMFPVPAKPTSAPLCCVLCAMRPFW